MPFHVVLIITLFLLQQGEGANVTVPEGHWRISLDEETILRCPYGANSCLGGTSAGDFLCSDGFSGLLCAVPDQNHYIEWSAQDSLFCDDATTLGSFVIPVVVLMGLLVFICRNVGLREGARQKRDSSAFCKIFSHPASQSTSTSSISSSSTTMVPAASPASVRLANPHRPHDCTATPTSLQSARPVSSPTLSVVATSVTAENETEINGMREGDDYAADANFDLLHKIKILIFAMQISCSLPSVLHISFGPYLSSLLQYFSYLSVASLQMLPWPCYASSALFAGAGDLRAMSYVELMQTASVLPLAALAVVCVLYALHMECVHLVTQDEDKEHQRILHDRYTRKYGTGVLLVLYISQAGVWQMLSGVLFSPCVQTDPDQTIAQNNQAYRVMLADPTVQCSSSTYQFGYLWAVVGAIIYAFAVPMVEALLVHVYSDHITMYHHHNSILNNNNGSVSATVAVPATLSKKFTTKYSTKFGNNNKFSAKFADKDFTKPSGRFSSHFHIYISSSDSHSSSSSDESEFDVENNKSSSKRVPLDGLKSSSLSDKLGFRAAFKQSKGEGKGKSYEILRKRSANHYFGGVGLLYQAYKSDRCYWELVDSFYRLFFVAMLPALFPYANPMQLLVGIAVTMLFIKIQMHYKPFVNPANERLMQCALVQVFLLLVCAMGSELDLPEIHYGTLHLYDGFMCLVALLTPLLFLYHTLFTTYSPPISTTPANTTTTTSTNLAITSPSVLTHRPHPAVLHNNARNSFSECDTASEGERCTPRQSRRNSSRRYASSRSSSQRYSQKHVSANSGRSHSSPRSPRSSKNAVRESTSHKVRQSNSTAEYSHPSSHSNEQEEHKEDGVRFSVNQQGLLLSTPPRRSRNNNTTTSPHRPHTATHNTPPHNKNRNNSSEARAIPTMFTFDRDLAVYTHETVTYDQLSAEKAAREKNAHNVSHDDHLSQSFMYQSEGEHSSGIENNGLNTPLYQSESENLTESEEEEEKHGEWSTDSDNECASPKYALNMATTSYNSVNLSNKQSLYISNSNRRQNGAHSTTDFHTVRNTALNRVSVHKAPSPVSTPPHSDLDCDSAGSFGRADKVDDVRNMRTTYSPASSVSGSVKGNKTVVQAKSDRPIWHSMFSDPSDGEEELPLRRIPSIFSSPETESASNTNANTVTTKTTRALPSPLLLLAPLHTNSNKLHRTVSGVSNKYANRPLPALPAICNQATKPTTEHSNNNSNNSSDALPVSPEVDYTNTSIYGHASLLHGDNALVAALAAGATEDAVGASQKFDLDENIINNYTDTVPLNTSNKADSAEPVLAPVILTVKCSDHSEDSANEGSVDGTMATLFGNNRNKANVSSPGRVIVKPAYHNNNKGIWGMVRNVFGGGNQDNKPAKPVVTLNSGLSGTLLRTMTDIDLNDIEDRESENSDADQVNVYSNRGNRSKSDSSGDNIGACYAYEGSSNFTEGFVGDGFDV